MTPTPAQIEAGNYRKQHRRFAGLDISIENPVGSVRSGTDRNGKSWRIKMRNAYGYVRGSMGVDGDHVDCYLGPDEDAPMVYVVHQRQVGNWDKFDEDKCMLGFASEKAARDAFLAHYTDPRFLGPITAMPIDEFKKKVLATKDAPKMIKAILFIKAHNQGYSYTRGGKTVVVNPFDDKRIKSARVTAHKDDRTMDLFGGGDADVARTAKTEIFLRAPNAREKTGGAARQRGFNNLGAPNDGYEHVYKPYGSEGAGYYAVPKGENTPKWHQPNTITTPRSEMIKEHEKLVDVLNSPSHKDDRVEAKKQEKELKEYKGASAPKFDPAKQIKIAADSIKKLRTADVERALTDGLSTAEQQSATAAYIKQHRPDLAGEVDDIMSDQDIAIAPADSNGGVAKVKAVRSIRAS